MKGFWGHQQTNQSVCSTLWRLAMNLVRCSARETPPGLPAAGPKSCVPTRTTPRGEAGPLPLGQLGRDGSPSARATTVFSKFQ